MDAYATRTEQDRKSFRFIVNGHNVAPGDTPLSVRPRSRRGEWRS